jgi:hypothetical protein
MSEDENGGPAFAYGSWEHGGDSGMTLRDYFAGQALSAVISKQQGVVWHGDLAKQAYQFADAMLEARKAPTGETP